MKYRIRNINTKKIVSEPVAYHYAQKHCALMNNNFDIDAYEVVRADADLPEVERAMTSSEKLAVKNLTIVTFKTGVGHYSFIKALCEKINKHDFTITEKQSAYLWFICYHYRRQLLKKSPIGTFLVDSAKRNKVY